MRRRERQIGIQSERRGSKGSRKLDRAPVEKRKGKKGQQNNAEKAKAVQKGKQSFQTGRGPGIHESSREKKPRQRDMMEEPMRVPIQLMQQKKM